MGSEESGIGLETPELNPKEQAIRDGMSKIMDDHPELPIHMMVAFDDETGFSFVGQPEVCMPCLLKYMLGYVLSNFTMHNMIAHKKEIEKARVDSQFADLQVPNDGKAN